MCECKVKFDFSVSEHAHQGAPAFANLPKRQVRRYSMNSTKLFLIRHGQTDWNLEGKVQGHTDIPLNTKGKEQAQKVAEFLKRHIELKALYSSDLQRAHQTAKEIDKLFSLGITLSADLREGYLGKIEGLTQKEISDLYGPINCEALELLPEVLEAEQRHEVVTRIKKFLIAIAHKHKGQQIAIVTHGFALRSLISYWGYNLQNVPHITNTSIITVTWQSDQEDIFHLESIEQAD